MNAFLKISAFCAVLLLSSCATTQYGPTNGCKPQLVRENTVMTIGGADLSMLIRGENRENPILLFLHGGPGFSEMPTYPRNADLEKDFVVVQWDQRGAGKSFRPTTPPESMAVAQFVSDTHELTEKLCEKFNRRKVILVGFSFGSLVGLQAVEQRPDLYHAYVGLSHFITIPESEAILDQEGRERARKQNRPELLAELETIGPPPYDGKKPERRVNAIIKELVSEKVDNPFPDIEYIGKSMLSKYYFFPDFVSLAFGRSFSGKHMKTELYTIDIRDHVKAIDVPTLWISGRYDTTISQTLARGFFDDLHAPSGKKWVWFENTGHPVHLEKPAQFRSELREFVHGLGNFR